MDTQEVTRWALAVPLPGNPSRAIGAGHVGRVLVALVQYASADGIAFPSAQTLADDVSGLSRRDVRNALDVLADAGIIEHAERPRPGRVVRWRLNLAGYPATRRPGGIPRHPLPKAVERPSEPGGQPGGEPGGQPGGEPGGVSRHEVEEEEKEKKNNEPQRFAPRESDDESLSVVPDVGPPHPVADAPAARADDDEGPDVTDVGLRSAEESTDPAESEQLALLADLAILKTCTVPSANRRTSWQVLTRSQAADKIREGKTALRSRAEFGPARGSAAYAALTPAAQTWADDQRIPGEINDESTAA